jgi:hypothetical protein
MKPLRTLIIFGSGVVAGISIARRIGADEPEVLHGPSQRESTNPALRAASAGLTRAGDRATIASLDAIRRARGVIRARLGEDAGDDAAWG